MKHWTLTLVGLLLLVQLQAQERAMLRGVVVESTTKGTVEPIAGAVLHWIGTTQAASTDTLGVFHIPLPTHGGKLVVQALGFKNDTLEVSGNEYLRVMMISKRQLSDVVVNYERKSTEVSFIDPWKTTIMHEKELFKAACCNLSESFETNPSVDVAYNDALTGSKQIQMLGLSGQYTQMSVEQLPGIRGIATHYGLNYYPGTWINSIQVSKGMGSVVNGFESISGQINVELHKPTVKEKVYWNGYVSQGGRYETNLVLAQQPGKQFSHALFLHGSTYAQRMDQNNDGYLDNPVGEQINGLYRFFFDNKTGWVVHGGVHVLRDRKLGGQFNIREYDRDTANPTLYGTMVDAQRVSGFLKVGYVFTGNKYRSIGLQLHASDQQFKTWFGKNSYDAMQKSAYANLIYQDIIGNPDHRVRGGFSLQTDLVDEMLYNKGHHSFLRDEQVAGSFLEYTYTYKALFTMVAGARADYHNYFGWMYTPRLHLRYAPVANTVIRAVAGKGWRTPSLVAENLSMLASSRTMVFSNAHLSHTAYGFQPEVAWNYGMNLQQEFKINGHNGSLGVDYYYTNFASQVVVDRESSAREVRFYQLKGISYSNSLQVQVDYHPVRRLDLRFAWRWFDVRMQYDSGLRQMPMIAKERWFANLSYTTRNKWNFDVTVNRTGPKRLPVTLDNPEALRLPAYSEAFWLVNLQVSKTFKKGLDAYLGIENLLNFQQPGAIVDAPNPFGNYFDAGMIWGPVFGRMAYAGFRLKI